MVCLGNICRSPLADGLMRQKSKEQNLGLEIDSAGTSAFHIGEGPDRRMTQTAKKHNLDISYLKARQFVSSDFDEFDLIFAMDLSNKENILKLARNKEDTKKVRLMLNETFPGENMEVPDPYYGGDEGFEHVYHLLNNACESVIDKIKNKTYA